MEGIKKLSCFYYRRSLDDNLGTTFCDNYYCPGHLPEGIICIKGKIIVDWIQWIKYKNELKLWRGIK